MGFVRDEGRAEDVTQEAFLSAYRRIRNTDSEIAFRPWIYEIARNAAIDLHRRTSKTEEVSISEDDSLRPADRRRLVGSAAPEAVLADKQRLDHLRSAFEELSESHHRILVLRELEGRTYREIGEEMQLTAPAVESTLFRARRRLEHEYAEIDTGRRCTSMRMIIGKLAEGVESPRERAKLARHARRCTLCRKRARELGVSPFDTRERSIAARAAALLPLPGFIQRRLGPQVPGDPGAAIGVAHAAAAAEGSGVLLAKAGALLAAAAFVGGGAHIAGSDPSTQDRILPDAGPAKPAAKPGEAAQREARAARRPAAKGIESLLGGRPRSVVPRVPPASDAERRAETPSEPTAPQAGPAPDPSAGVPTLPQVGEPPQESGGADGGGSVTVPEADSQSSAAPWRPDGPQASTPDLSSLAASAIDG